MNAICFLCVNPEKELCVFASTIKNYNVFILLDNNCYDLTTVEKTYTMINFIKVDDITCASLGFKNANTFGIKKTPTAWDKFFYYFNHVNTDYSNVWAVEEDVFIYNSDAFENIDSKYQSFDLLVAGNNNENDSNSWRYWYMGKDKIDCTLYNSMVCACRLSRKLLNKIGEYANEYRELFYIEIMINTIAMKNKCTIHLPQELSTICCKPDQNKRYRILNSNGKLEWISDLLPNSIKINYMYHPVKNLELHTKWRNLKI